MQTSAFKFLPLLLAAFVLVGAVAFAGQKLIAKKKIEGVFTKLPEPAPFVTVKPARGDTAGTIPSPTPTPTLIPQTNEPVSPVKLATTTETVCTPVYGMANSCAEHAVVDTGLETGAFVNAGVLSYVLGLAVFIKAKHIA